MKLAILQCDEVLEKFQPEFGRYPQAIKRMFDGCTSLSVVDSFDCRRNEYPSDIDAYDCFITTGSRASVYDQEPWIHALIEFVRELDRCKKKFIGICFGHQLIAMAKNCLVEKSPKGWGVGMALNRIVATPAWMCETKETLNIIVSHQDQVITLPGDALVIAESDFCPYFVVQWNDHFLSIQGHPEWNRDYSRALMDARRAIIRPETIAAGLESLAIEPDNTLFARWIIYFVKHKNINCNVEFAV